MTEKTRDTIRKWLIAVPIVAAIFFFLLNAAFATDADVEQVNDRINSLRADQSDIRYSLKRLEVITCAGLTADKKALVGCPQ